MASIQNFTGIVQWDKIAKLEELDGFFDQNKNWSNPSFHLHWFKMWIVQQHKLAKSEKLGWIFWSY